MPCHILPATSVIRLSRARGPRVSAETLKDLHHAMSNAQEGAAAHPTRSDSTFEELFLAHYHRIVAVLFRLTGDRMRAEELAGEVLWKACRQSSSSVVNGNLSGWLYRTASNLGIEDLRASARRQRYEHAAASDIRNAAPSSTPLDEVLRAERRGRVHAVLASLKRWQAQILILRSSGLSYKELAAALDLRAGSVGTMLARAEAQFHQRYVQLHGGEEWS